MSTHQFIQTCQCSQYYLFSNAQQTDQTTTYAMLYGQYYNTNTDNVIDLTIKKMTLNICIYIYNAQDRSIEEFAMHPHTMKPSHC